MSVFMGGSAYSMAHQIADGYILVSASTFKRYNAVDLKTLATEIEKLAREIRAEIPPQDDLPAVQKKNRKMGRLIQAQLIMRGPR